ncbi:neuraminidase-like domain-containing protein [uncultured Serinicoccus sp.]|uniref:neuraminidase-like domain-containing protein n=1 Tax=uncultured Serinicoccus sp. TaxID=735514 RepID=UPI002616D6AE|nr:neuraminidase-like domain-containing protein [uncultured Serinicoccus sp.]
MAGLSVEATVDHGRQVGRAVTRPGGSFEMVVELPDRLPKNWAAILTVRRGQRVLVDEDRGITWDPRKPQVVRIALEHRPPVTPEDQWVEGVVVGSDRSPAAGVVVRVLDRRVGEPAELGRTVTDVNGRYVIGYSGEALGTKAAPDLVVCVERPDGDELTRTATVWGASARQTVNVIVPAAGSGPAGELHQLRRDVNSELGEVGIGDVGADDVEYLARRIGWDPRVLTMYVAAERASAQNDIAPAHYFALFRGGLAADADAVHRVRTSDVRAGLEAAIEAGVLSRDEASIEQTLERHARLRGDSVRASVPPGGTSTVGEMLSIRLDDDDIDRVIDIANRVDGDPGQLWQALREEGFEDNVVERLRFDGRLGMLTGHNANVVGRLAEQEVSSVNDLVRSRLYAIEGWEDLVGNDVPAGLDRQDYLAGLADQIRLAAPDLVTADLVRRRDVDLGGSEVAALVADFIESADGPRLGAVPLRRWDGFEELPGEAQQAALRLERLRQITPSDEALAVLAALGIGSARELATSYSEEQFVARHGGAFSSPEIAALVIRKAHEVFATIVNIAMDEIARRTTPSLTALSGPPPPVDGDANEMSTVVSTAARLEELFGSLDFCACAHCSSVLSPAAYLVDLFEFLDLSEIDGALANPIEVLFERRPDLQHLLLSCENTNVALPYVDLVNEILEHIVVNEDLATFEGQNTTADERTEDLLVDPARVASVAYDPLRDAVYPTSLPFDLPLETVRRHFESWDAPLYRVMEQFGAPATAVRRERLGLTETEWSILTDHAFRSVPTYYGEQGTSTLAQLQTVVGNARELSRRLDMTYVELTAMIGSNFVNPASEFAPQLQLLGLPLALIADWIAGTVQDADLVAQLPPGLDETPFGGSAIDWLTANKDVLGTLLALVPTPDADPLTDDCDFSKLEVRRTLAPGDSDLAAIDYHRVVRFVRLWRMLSSLVGADVAATDDLLVALSPVPPAEMDLADLDSSVRSVLLALANLMLVIDEVGANKRERQRWVALVTSPASADERHRELAALLDLGAVDHANLQRLTGTDPLTDDLGSVDPSLLRYARALKRLRNGGMRVADLSYLLLDDDPTGAVAPTDAEVFAWIHGVRTEMAGATASLGKPSDLASLQSVLGLVHGADVVARFMGLLTGTTTYGADITTPVEVLPTGLTAAAPALRLDEFDDRLTHVGPVTPSIEVAVEAALNALGPADIEGVDTASERDDFVAAMLAALVQLRADTDAAVAAFEVDHPELAPPLAAGLAADGEAAIVADVHQAAVSEIRRSLRTTAVGRAVATLLRVDEQVASALLGSETVVASAADSSRPARDDFLALAIPTDFSSDGTHRVQLDPALTGPHRLAVTAPTGTTVSLVVDGVDVIPTEVAGPSAEVRAAARVDLTATRLVGVELTVAGLPPGGEVFIFWRSEGTSYELVPAGRVMGQAAVDHAETSLRRLHKAALVIDWLGLTAREVAQLAAVDPATTGVLVELPVGAPIDAADLPAAWVRFGALLDWSTFLEQSDVDRELWVDALTDQALLTEEGPLRVATLARWRQGDVTDAVARLGGGTPAGSVLALHWVARDATLAASTGRTVEQLQNWSQSPPTSGMIDEITTAVRSDLGSAAWRESARTINDELRNRRRDSLVAYILHVSPFGSALSTPEELYERLLVDVEMDACMQTSRIRLALSTVQLFVQRILLGLEPGLTLPPDHAKQWEWLRRYRVAEAGKKIFLWPENWCEPELRDGMSVFFKELQGQLLQSDITDELAERAYLDYLRKLDAVAQLEIVGLHLQERPKSDARGDILHVIGRTRGTSRQYFYRRHDRTWSPWEKVPLDIEGEQVVPVVWRERLLLLWLTALDIPRAGTQNQRDEPFASQEWTKAVRRKDVELTLNWAEYDDGQWVIPASTDVADPIRWSGLKHDWDARSARLLTRVAPPTPDSRDVLVVGLASMAEAAKSRKTTTLRFKSTNAPPDISSGLDNLLEDTNCHLMTTTMTPVEDGVMRHNRLQVTDPLDDVALLVVQPDGAASDSIEEGIMKRKRTTPAWWLRTVMHQTSNRWLAPLVVYDSGATFLVRPKERVRSGFVYDEPFLVVPSVTLKYDPIVIEEVELGEFDPLWDPVKEGFADPDAWFTLTGVSRSSLVTGAAYSLLLRSTRRIELDGRTFGPIDLEV